MSIISAQRYEELMRADQRRIFAILVNEVGMKKAKEIARRVVSDEPVPADAMLLDAFDAHHGSRIEVEVHGASGAAEIRALVQQGVREAMSGFGHQRG